MKQGTPNEPNIYGTLNECVVGGVCLQNLATLEVSGHSVMYGRGIYTSTHGSIYGNTMHGVPVLYTQ